MRPFAVIDSETDPFLKGRIPEPFVWGFYDGKEFRHYTHATVHSMIEYISTQKIIVYAHNGGKFDYHFLLSYLEPYDSIKIISGRLSQFFIGKAEFRDSMNILPVALSKIEMTAADGKTIKKQEFDYALMEKDQRHRPENWELIIDYLRDDCLTLYAAVEAFQNEYGRHLTQAGAAMAQWKTLSKGVEIPKSTPEFFDTFKEYYFGGRVECFSSGIVEKNFSVFDINSAYPYAMLDQHAYGLEFIESDAESPDYKRETGFFIVSAESNGAFPLRGKKGLSFPDDGIRRTFHVTGWELQAAIDTKTDGHHKVEHARYPIQVQSFAEYVEYFYAKRLQAKAVGDSAGDLFAKMLLCGLYGKFGANPENYSNFVILPPSELDDLLDPSNDYNLSGELGCWLLGERELNDDEMRFYNVSTAASITGFVRAYLWRAICRTGRDAVLYCDTDSIATLSEGHGLETGKALGMWKHEGEFDKAGIGGKKLYIFQGKEKGNGKREYKTASKGARLTHAQLWKVAEGRDVTYSPDSPTFSVHYAPHFVSRKIRLTL